MYFTLTNSLHRVCLRRVEKANQQVVTRSRTGNLPPPRPLQASNDSIEPSKVTVTNKATPEEIKEKMEQQLRMQRAAHQQKRALEVKNLNVKNPLEMIGTTAQCKCLC